MLINKYLLMFDYIIINYYYNISISQFTICIDAVTLVLMHSYAKQLLDIDSTWSSLMKFDGTFL